ncbi:hypothetical protein FOZG_00037 [Fusarium oxysporum Fo47]|uniref:Major facilitator superfamily (MFS) profile domain-containing protein n=1 Tax=Fusarium oxysporum Fo47 TaxID=660027 RepID=W9KX60_FUSOX|nr:hypothetical protein FOZG_00037 [Fusarium oxysporum Fo47]
MADSEEKRRPNDAEYTKTKALPHWRLVIDQAGVTPEVLAYDYQGSGTEQDPFVVQWIPHDPRNPQQWSDSKKWFITAAVATATLTVSLVSSAYTGGMKQIIRDFHLSEEVATLGISLFVLGFALGPLLWAPLSEIFGRQLLFIGTYAGLTIFNAACAGAPNGASLLVFRFLAGSFGSSPLTNAGGAIADMFPPHQRGLAMTLFVAGPSLGPVLGPICGGFLGMNASWRWVMGFLAIFAGVMWIGGTILIPETYAPTLLRRRAAKLSSMTGKVYTSTIDLKQGKVSLRSAIGTSLLRPWILLFKEPIVLLLSIYMAIIYGTLYLFFAAFPVVFEQARGWSQGIEGLAFLGIAVGMLAALIYTIPDNKRYVLLDKKHNGFAPPEARLPPAIIGSFSIPLGLFWFAWTNYPSIHWIVSIMAGAPFGFGLILVFLSIMNYLVDAYTIFAASVLAANSILRSLFGAAFPLFTVQMYDNLGLHWASTVPAFLALACVPFPYLFYVYGARIRIHCKFSAESDAFMQSLKQAQAQNQREQELEEQDNSTEDERTVSCMLKLINELSDKPEWWRKVKDEAISSKWKKEALEMDWTSYRKHADFTSAMADACISELRNKAELYEETGLMPVYDYTTTVIKSDGLLTPDLAKALQEGVNPLEDVPPELKDWHPNSKEQVLDIVHPSLRPLIYGRSRVLNDRVIEVDNALASCGTGVVLRAPGSEQTTHIIGEGGFCEDEVVVLSNKFQWLPCDVDLNPETGKAKIASYINNLHPQEHAHLYPIIEKFIEKSLPAWDIIYDWEDNFSVQRLTATEAEYDEYPCPDLCDIEDGYGCTPWRRSIGKGEEPRYDVDSWEEMLADGEEDDCEPDYYELGAEKAEDYKTNPERRNLDDAWFASTHSAKLPDADPSAKDHMRIQPSDVKANGFFNSSSQIQAIVKLADIHLTPEKPVYNGGSWHTEGLLNEHIVSTALYYYDSENITDCTLDFRTCADKEDLAAEISYEQYRHDPIERTFDITLGGSIFQDIGSVLTKAGRALFFPNVLLADPTKPGHRKILALFLVDPAILIISSSNVPPQQKHWWTTYSGLDSGCGIMPPELVEKVVDYMDWPIDLEEAKKLRLYLMKERTSFKAEEESRFERMEWNFCEH